MDTPRRARAPLPNWIRQPDLWIFLAFWLGLMVVGRSRFLRDADTFWHTVAGQTFLRTRHFFETDSFSFTFFGQPWTPYEWLAECTMAGLHAVGGLDAILLATVTLLAGVYAWVARRLLQSGLAPIPTLLVVIMLFAAGASNLHARPSIVTVALLGLLYAWLLDFEAGRIPFRRLLWLIPIFVVWTNWHGGMLGGLATLGLFSIGWAVPRLAGPQRREAWGILGLTAACGLTAFVNPYGVALPRTWLQIMQSPVIPRLILEHRPPDPRRGEFWILLIPGVVYLIVLASTLPRRPQITWLIPIVWMALALSRVRHGALFGITTALAIADMLPGSRVAEWLARPGRDLFDPRADSNPARSARPVLVPLGLFLLVLALQATGLHAPVVGRNWAKLDPTHWPMELRPELVS